MMGKLKRSRIGALLLVVCIAMMSMTAEAAVQRNREAGKKKAATRIGVGAAIGGAAGGIIGGRKGALIGAGAGAGGGAIYHAHKKRTYRRHHPLRRVHRRARIRR